MTIIKTNTIALVLSGLLSVAACGGGGDDYDTAGDVFVAVAEAFCDQAIDCNLITASQRDQCETAAVDGACQEVDCDDEFDGDASDVDDCIDDIDSLSCAAVEEGTLPARCLTL